MLPQVALHVTEEWPSCSDGEETEEEKEEEVPTVINYDRCRTCFQPTSEWFVHPLYKPENPCWEQKGLILCGKCDERVKNAHRDLSEHENCFLCCEHYPITFKCSSCPFVLCEGCASANYGKQQWEKICKLSDSKQWQCFQCAPTAPHNAFLPQLDLAFRVSRGYLFDDNFISGYFDLHRRLEPKRVK